MRGGGVSVLVLLFLIPTAWAADGVQLQGDLIRLRVEGPASIAASEFLLRIEPGADAEGVSSLGFEGRVVVRQYWQNETTLRDPKTGEEITGLPPTLESKELAQAPDGLALLNPGDRPDLRLHVEAAAPARIAEARDADLVPAPVQGPWIGLRASDADPALASFARPDPDAVWITLRPGSVAAPHQRLLVDGWHVMLTGPDAGRVINTGLRDVTNQVGTGDLGVVQQVRRVLTFLVIDIHDGAVRFDRDPTHVEGYVRHPYLAWAGASEAVIGPGKAESGEATIVLAGEPVQMDGRFAADIRSETGAHRPVMTVSGTGDVSALPSAANTFVRMARDGGGLSALGVMAMAAIALVTVGVLRRRRRQPAAAEPAPEALMDQVRREPLNGEVHLELAAMIHGHSLPTALVHLDRSFRLRPDLLMRFLEDPKFESLRNRNEVRMMLLKMRRESEQRTHAGYA